MMKPRLLIFAVAALLAIHANAASAATQAGVSAAVRGDIDLTPATGEAKHQAASGEDIYLGDEISTYDDAGMQLMLLDETVFTIGANTDITVDEFVYDPATGAGQVTASLAKGVLRFVTGNIAQGDPEDMTINLPVGTIGIRGTTGAVVFDGVNPALVVLLGPGPRNNADAREGRLAVSAAGQTVNLTRTGWGTSVAPGQPPTDAFPLSAQQIASIVNQLTPQPTTPEPVDESEGGRATQAADQDTAEAKLTAPRHAAVKGDSDEQSDSGTSEKTGLSELFDELGTRVSELSTTSDTIGAILDGITSFDQLRTIETGIFHYFVPFSEGVFTQISPVVVGQFQVKLDIDFGARTAGGGNSSITVNTSCCGGSIFDSTSINPFSYADDVGLAQGVFDASDLNNSFFAGTSGSLNNSNGIIANTATIDIIYDNGSFAGTGSGTSNPREVGLAP